MNHPYTSSQPSLIAHICFWPLIYRFSASTPTDAASPSLQDLSLRYTSTNNLPSFHSNLGQMTPRPPGGHLARQAALAVSQEEQERIRWGDHPFRRTNYWRNRPHLLDVLVAPNPWAIATNLRNTHEQYEACLLMIKRTELKNDILAKIGFPQESVPVLDGSTYQTTLYYPNLLEDVCRTIARGPYNRNLIFWINLNREEATTLAREIRRADAAQRKKRYNHIATQQKLNPAAFHSDYRLTRANMSQRRLNTNCSQDQATLGPATPFLTSYTPSATPQSCNSLLRPSLRQPTHSALTSAMEVLSLDGSDFDDEYKDGDMGTPASSPTRSPYMPWLDNVLDRQAQSPSWARAEEAWKRASESSD